MHSRLATKIHAKIRLGTSGTFKTFGSLFAGMMRAWVYGMAHGRIQLNVNGFIGVSMLLNDGFLARAALCYARRRA